MIESATFMIALRASSGMTSIPSVSNNRIRGIDAADRMDRAESDRPDCEGSATVVAIDLVEELQAQIAQRLLDLLDFVACGLISHDDYGEIELGPGSSRPVDLSRDELLVLTDAVPPARIGLRSHELRKVATRIFRHVEFQSTLVHVEVLAADLQPMLLDPARTLGKIKRNLERRISNQSLGHA